MLAQRLRRWPSIEAALVNGRVCWGTQKDGKQTSDSQTSDSIRRQTRNVATVSRER